MGSYLFLIMIENVGGGSGLEGRGKEWGERRIWVWGMLSLRCPWVGPPGGEALVVGNED